MPNLPSGTVTFLFSDVEGSTRLWEEHPEPMRTALARHDALIEDCVAEHGGCVGRPRGEGDSRFCVFARATDAVAAAARIQRALSAEPWPTPIPIAVRLALHTGEAELRGGDYYGTAVNRCARLRAIGSGGQALLSMATEELVRDSLPSGAALRDLGQHRLRDLRHAETIYQLVLPGLPADFPPLRTDDQRPAALPVPAARLLGRAAETAELRALLLDPAVRLVTLTGPGGTGKTRLAVEVAADLADHFADGVFFVDLAPIRDPELVGATIGQALGVWDAGHQPIVDRLKRFLAERELLLLLDNVEQVVAGAPLVGELLAACPGVKALATSRSPLRLAWERVVALGPLALPDRARLDDPARVGRSAAVALFVERARALRSDFALTAQNGRAIGEICHRLEGLPLALELAAARIALLPPPAMLARLAGAPGGSPLQLLAGGGRDQPARHQTMRDAVAWSYDLLSPDEQSAFRRLAVFVGGFALEAAQAVCDPERALAPDVLDLVGSLAEKSLVLAAPPLRDEPRFRSPETIREFALERLAASGERAATRTRHARYFVDLAATAERACLGPDVAAWLDRLEAELDNLRAALEWCQADQDRQEDGLRLAGALWMFWDTRGYQREGRAWIEAALAALPAGAAARMPVARAKALTAAGYLAMVQGDYPAGQRLLEESLAISRALGDERAAALTLHILASGEVQALADEAPALAHTEEQLAIARRLGDGWIASTGLFNLGLLAWRCGDDDRARAVYEEGLAIGREIQSTFVIPYFLQNLGLLAWRRGDYAHALALEREALALRRDLGDKRGISLSLEGLAWLAGARRQPERAARLFGAAEALRETLGVQLHPYRRNDHDRSVAAARAQLGGDAFAAAWAAGRARPLEDAIDEALAPDEPVAAPADGPLSPRELEVAGLIAQGLTNQEIADRLVIGRRTAETHAANILGKLGLSARPQIAAWFVERARAP